MGGYDPLRGHPFFETISWGDLHVQTPPKLTPYLPAMSEDDEDCYGNVRHFHPYIELGNHVILACGDFSRILLIHWIYIFVPCKSPCNNPTNHLLPPSPVFPQYDDLLSQFSSMQVAQSSSSHSLSTPETIPPAPQRSSSNIEQYIHDLDNNSFELDLLFSEEEKQLLLEKQTSRNPW